MADDIASLQIRVLSQDVESANKRLAALEAQGAGAERSVSKLGSSSKITFGTIAAGIGSVVSIGAVTGAAVHQWIAYDKAMKEVQSISSASRVEFQALRSDVLELSASIGVDATVAAKGLYQALSAGVPKENVIEFMRVASKSAIAGVTDVNVAVDGLTNTINAYKLPVTDAMTVSDKLFAAVVDGKTTFEELSSNMSKASVTAAAMGVPLDDLLASVIAITQQGTPTSEAFTQIKATLTALLDPADEMKVALDAMGVSSGRQAVQQYGLANALQMVRDRFEGNDGALVKALRSTEAYSGVLSMTGANLASFDKGLASVQNSVGKTEKAFADNSNTLENALTGAKSAFIGFVESIETNLGPIRTVTGLIKEMTGALNAMSNMGFESINSAATMGGVGGAMQLQKMVGDLEAKKGELEAKLARQTASPNMSMTMGGMAPVFPSTATSGELTKVTEQLARARQELAKFDEATVKSATLQQGLMEAVQDGNKEGEAIARQRIAAAQDEQAAAEERAAIDKQVAELEILLKEKKVEIADKQLAKENELAEAKKKQTEEEKRGQEALRREAENLSTTEREKLELKIKQLETLKAQGPEEAAVADKAIAAVRQQIEEYDKLQAKKLNLPGGGGGGASDALLPGKGELDDREIANQLEARYNTEQSLLQASLDNRAITEEDFQNRSRANWQKYNDSLIKMTTTGANTVRIRQLEMHAQVMDLAANISNQLTELAGEDSKRSKAAFAIAKSVSIAQAVVNTELAATRALAEGGFYAGIPMATIIRGLGYASVGLMAGTALRQFAHGGMIASGEVGIVGEAGPEFVRGPAVVTSAKATEGLLRSERGSGKPYQIIVNTLPGETAKVAERGDGDIVEITITKTLDRLATEVHTGGGKVVPALARKYGLKRQGGA